MRRPGPRRAAAAALILAALSACKSPPVRDPGETAADEAERGNLSFIPQPPPYPRIPPEVGLPAERSRPSPGAARGGPEDETGPESQDSPEDPAERRRAAFREAYAEALLRGLPLTGVLGGDRVNPWPNDGGPGGPESWCQNWAGAGVQPNSWGVPGLVLALENHAETGGPVYTIHGRILHLYGLSAGRGGANGAAGYGVPLGEAFYENGGTAQRFSRGRIAAGPEGDRFIPGDDPCLARLASLSPGERDREFGGVPPAAGEAFARAWAFTFTDREGESDGPIVRLTCPKPWIIQTREEDIAVTGFYVKSYNQGKDALVLVEGPPLPFRARRLGGAILSLLLRREKLPGIEGKRPLGTASGGGPLARSLAAGLAIYGPPLSDPLPFPAEEGGEARREAQRFGRGWLVLEGKREAPRMEADGE